MNEMASTHARLMIEALLNVHALANMHRGSGDDEYRKTAAGWLDQLERELSNLRYSLREPAAPTSEER